MARMGRPTTITDEVRAQVLELAREGVGRNEIVRRLGISAGSVTAITKPAGTDFGKPHLETATKARQRELADRRTRLELKLLTEAEKLVGEIRRPLDYRQAVGGQDPQVMRWQTAEPMPVDKLKLMQAAAVALDKSLKLADVNSGQTIEQGKSMLTDLIAGLRIIHRETVPTEGDQPA